MIKKKTETVGFRVSITDREWLEKKAEEKECSISHVIVNLIKAEINRELKNEGKN